MIDETHDAALTSWVASANDPDTDFPLQNLPFGVFVPGDAAQPRIGVAIGDQIVDLARAAEHGALARFGAREIAPLCRHASLAPLMAAGPDAWTPLRLALSRLLRADEAGGSGARDASAHELLVAMADVRMVLPCAIGDYTDFYASLHHATNVGRLFRPDNPVLPNYKYVPIAYHGRASSVVVSGTPVVRPRGQRRDPDTESPVYAPSNRLDYECEIGFFVGPGNPLGSPVPVSRADAHVFGFCLVNDWSARDLQAWEYQPLGPFLAKSFATSVSPWIVPTAALEPFRAPAPERPSGDPSPLPYLDARENRARGAFDISVEVELATAALAVPVRLSRASFRDMYWTPAQMLAHHTSNGCNLRPGDLLASGTISGAEPTSRGCLLELTNGGRDPVPLPFGDSRRFLHDFDTVTLRGWCERPGARRIGFGACVGTVQPAAA